MAILALGATAGMADDGEGNPIADTYGNKTETAGTAIKRLIPVRESLRARVTELIYTAAATPHTVTLMTALESGRITQDAVDGQAVIVVDDVPTNPIDGGILAANDWVTFKYEDGSWETAIVSSVSGFSITLTANLARDVDEDTKIYYHFAPADHANRRFLVAASTTLKLDNGNICTSPGISQPILVHSDNSTNAGTMVQVSYTFVGGNPA